MFKVILRSIGACPIFLVFDNLVSQKGLAVERNGVKFETPGY